VSCRNCGAPLATAFCGECGQRAIDPDPTLREFVHELAEQFLQWDGRIASSFRLLVLRPGALTLEYFAGRRARYLSPLRLYLLCSVLYFFVSALTPRAPTVVRSGRDVSTQIGPIVIKENDSTSTIAALDTLAADGRWVGRVWGRHFGNAMRHRGELTTRLASAIPKTMFVLVPFFAALVALVHWRNGRRYPQHLAFALHLHAVLFLALSLTLVHRFTTSTPLLLLVQLPVLAGFVVHFVLAERRVYGGSLRGAIARAGLVSFVYFFTFLAAMVLTFGLIVLLQF